jgi:hypothetical protein
MADVSSSLRNGDGIAFLVSAGIVYEIIAAACSSPQTTEINAGRRADTLMKWVNIGVVQAVALVGIAAYIDRKHAAAYLAGGGLAAALMYGQYIHAKRAGLKSFREGTEQY